MRRARGPAIVLLVLLLTACQAETAERAIERSPTAPMPGSSPSTSRSPSDRSPSPTGGLHVKTVARIPTTGWDAEQVDIFGDYVVWAGHEDDSGGPATVIYLHDLESRATRVLTRARKPWEATRWARGSGDHVVLLESKPSAWRVRIIELSTGRSTVIGRSGAGASGRYLPAPVISWPWVVWNDAVPAQQVTDERPGIMRLRAMNLATATTRLITTQRLYMPVLDGSQLSWVGVDDDREQDIYSVDLAAPAPGVRQLTTSGDVGGIAAADGHVVYYEPRVGDATAVRRVQYAGGAPEAVAAPGGGDLAAGIGFVLWFGSPNGIFAKRTDDASDAHELLHDRPAIITRLAADGQRAVYGEDLPATPASDEFQELTGRVLLHVVEITRARRRGSARLRAARRQQRRCLPGHP